MFTFSFSSAFAMTADTVSEGYFANHWKTLTTTTTDYTIGGVTFDKAVLATVQTEAKAVYDAYVENASTYSTVMTDYEVFKAALSDTATGVTNQDKAAEAFKLALAKAQLAADKADALAAFDTVPTYNYSTAVMSTASATALEVGTLVLHGKDYTYQQAAEKLVAYYKGEIEDLDDFDADVTYGDVIEAKTSMTNFVTTALYPLGYVTGATTYSLTKQYDLKVAYGAANQNGVVSATDIIFVNLPSATNLLGEAAVAGTKAVEAATVAAIKAANQQVYVAFVNESAANKTNADKWLKVANILAEDGIQATNTDTTWYLTRYEAITALEDQAALYKLEKKADGTLKYDAAQIDKNLAKMVLAAAKAEAQEVTLTTDANPAATAEAKADMLEKINYALENFVADNTAEETYYAAELAKVQGYVDACKAEVAAAEDADAMLVVYNNYRQKIEKVDTAAEVDATVFAGSGYETLLSTANAYVTYVNSGITATKDQLVTDSDIHFLKNGLLKLVGESGLRTNTEIKTLKDQVAAVVNALPTQNTMDAAVKAAKDAIAAVPAKAAVADLATVKAAVDAVKAAEKLVTPTGLNYTALDTAKGQIAAEYNLDFAKKYAAVTKTDKAALKALKAEIKAALAELKGIKASDGDKAYLNGILRNIGTDLGKIRTTEKEAVEAAIAAIPYTVDESYIPAVKAARNLYDAYAEEYKDITGLYDADEMILLAADGSDSLDISANAEAKLDALETILGLNAEPEYAAVEALKITAKSVAGKGYIKVSWTVKGDAAKADGYQVYRSTKANKGFKKAFTTAKKTYKNTKVTKGTRYYYKVRAYKTVDGVKYYSDWSNKAYRVAK